VAAWFHPGYGVFVLGLLASIFLARSRPMLRFVSGTLYIVSGPIGDMDDDADLDFDDIEEFVLGLTNPREYMNLIGVPPELNGDTDRDGDIDFDDIDSFVGLLNGSELPGTQSVPEPGTVVLLYLATCILTSPARRRLDKGLGQA